MRTASWKAENVGQLNPFAPTFEMFLEDSGTDIGPEEITVGLIGQQTYAFVANEVSGTISVSAISLLG